MKESSGKGRVKRVFRFGSTILLVAIMVFTFSYCEGSSSGANNPGGNSNPTSSRAYKGHENDKDMNNFAQYYPSAIGTRLDDCQSCHRSATLTNDSGKTVDKSTCDYCHLLVHPDPALVTNVPVTFRDTLNPYGKNYMDSGRSFTAISGIANWDSDGDGYINSAEISDLRYPGDPASKPGQPLIPMKILKMADIQAMTKHAHLQLNNANKQQFDDFAYYEGVKVKDLLAAAGVDMTGVTGISIIAPDGFVKDFSVKQINDKWPDGIFTTGLDIAAKGAVCGFVNYPPDQFTTGLGNGSPLPDQWLTIAYKRDGAAMQSSYLDPATLTIEGEGPFRIIVPQKTAGTPDRGKDYSMPSCGDAFDYDGAKDHNAGAMVRGVMAIRVNPMPAGYEEFDYKNGGWAYVDTKEILIYGKGVTP